ncbi:MAG: hypothetical protein C0425_00670 [Chlorobiaceae bacterium]|nr:hypothetical protein [Chlorobiaceae bacterium]MBA4308835.1 hypothetical protein [Chlorobiaceae bacterium]
MLPTKINLSKSKSLIINWSDGNNSEISLERLRRFCPCASCVTEKEKMGNSYFPIYNFDQLEVKNISVVGSYAITIHWADGHNTGIYDFPFLFNLGLSK